MPTSRTQDRAQQLKKQRFLASYRVLGNISRACRDADVNRASYYRWTEHDATFSIELNIAREEAIDALEDEARRRAVEGVVKETGVYHQGLLVATEVETKYSDTLLIFLLKGLKPEKYRDNLNVTSTPTIIKAIERTAWDRV